MNIETYGFTEFEFFWNGIFSNWYMRSFSDDSGVEYNCSEQYMMAGKAKLFDDDGTLKEIMEATHPSTQKQLGRIVKNFDRTLWDIHAKNIVYDGCYYKFTQNEDLLEKLLNTSGKLLVEASPYDTIWGIGLGADNPLALDINTWKGTNWLGEVLTNLRENLLKV